jgi:hypothetical protein
VTRYFDGELVITGPPLEASRRKIGGALAQVEDGALGDDAACERKPAGAPGSRGGRQPLRGAEQRTAFMRCHVVGAGASGSTSSLAFASALI